MPISPPKGFGGVLVLAAGGGALGPDVDDAGSTVAVLGWQRARDQADLVGKARVQHLAEAADRLGDDDAVDAVLQVGMVAAHMQLPEGVLCDPGACSRTLVQCGVVALRQCGDVFLVESVDRTAGLGDSLLRASSRRLADTTTAFSVLLSGGGVPSPAGRAGGLVEALEALEARAGGRTAPARRARTPTRRRPRARGAEIWTW